jgi:hypothetical protein
VMHVVKQVDLLPVFQPLDQTFSGGSPSSAGSNSLSFATP